MLRTTRLLNQIRERICNKHYILRTEHAYQQWGRLFVPWHGLQRRETWAAGSRGFSRHVAQWVTAFELLTGWRLRVASGRSEGLFSAMSGHSHLRPNNSL